jgi:hypothetical protein
MADKEVSCIPAMVRMVFHPELQAAFVDRAPRRASYHRLPKWCNEFGLPRIKHRDSRSFATTSGPQSSAPPSVAPPSIRHNYWLFVVGRHPSSVDDQECRPWSARMPSPLPSPRETALGSLDASGGAQGCVDEGPGRFLGNADPCRLYKLNVPRRRLCAWRRNPRAQPRF